MIWNLSKAMNGWRLTGLLTLAVVLMALGLVWSHGFDVEGVRLLIRATARTSFAYFAVAYGASALAVLSPGRLTAWVRANRRYWGVAFAGSHTVHAVAIGAFALMDRAEFLRQTMVANFVFGGLAYGFILAMAMTSFDLTAAWVGPKAWRGLHAVGAFYIWATFFVSAAKRAVYNPAYWIYVGLLVAILGVKLAARLRSSPARQRIASAR